MRFMWTNILAAIAVTMSLSFGGDAQAQNRAAAPQDSGAVTGDWPLHNADLQNSRFSPLDQINTSNVSRLAVKWSVQLPSSDSVAQMTPLVVDGVMYFNAASKLFALDASTGQTVWTIHTQEADPKPRSDGVPVYGGRGGRGPAYGDGRIYALAQSVIYAMDAKNGELVESFGDNGVLPVVNAALSFKYPDRYPPDADVVGLGYRLSAPPTYFDGTLYVGVASSDDLIEGGLMIALDGMTGAVRWVFTAVPVSAEDSGWELAKDTWGYGRRAGGGIWNQPAIDPDLGMVYLNAANPAPDYDGSARLGMNLFTNSIIALNAATGNIVWYFQTIHHDIWDKDLTNGPVLFDVQAEGRTTKGIASFGKTCYAYILDRETGQPINPIVETAVPTTTDVPGEQPWPTQPIPYTSSGIPQQPFCSVYPTVTDATLSNRVRPQFHPFLTNELVIISPGLMGGANWGPPSYSPRTGLLYATGRNDAFSLRVKVVGDTLEPGPNAPGHFGSFSEQGRTSVRPTQNVVAYDPVTGQQAWRTEIVEGVTNSGNLVTAGNLVFHGVGTGHFFAFDARSGQQLFKYSASTISSSPMTYRVNGEQYVSVMAGNRVLTFGLP